MANMKRGIAAPAIVAILAIIAIFGGTYYYNKGKGPSAQKLYEATIPLAPLNDSGQAGTAKISVRTDGKIGVTLKINKSPMSGEATTTQPSHIHSGACPTPGAVKFPLVSVVNGDSETVLDVTAENLLTMLPLAINVHASESDLGTYVACGDITDQKIQQLIKKAERASERTATTTVGTEKGESRFEDPSKKNERAEDVKAPVVQGYRGTVLAGVESPFLEFNRADYEAALKSNKVILLFFYAKWCPICKEEIKEAYAAFDDFQTDNVVGFRVNFNDDDTDGDEKALAKEFNITYQHTKVILKNGVQVGTKHVDSWNKLRYLSELSKSL